MLHLHPNSVSSDLWLNRDPFCVPHTNNNLLNVGCPGTNLSPALSTQFLFRAENERLSRREYRKSLGLNTAALSINALAGCMRGCVIIIYCIRLILRYKKGSQTITQSPQGSIIYHTRYRLSIKARGRERGRRAPGVLGIINVFSIFAFLNPWTHKLGSNRPKVTICRRKIGMDDKRKPFITVGMWKGRRSSICDMQIGSRSKETAL